MTQLTDKVFAIPLPEGAENIRVSQLLGTPKLFADMPGILFAQKLPFGSWRFLFTTKTATEEDARKVVAWIEIAGRIGYYDHGNPDPYRYLEKWEDSLHSLLRSKNLDDQNNYALIEKESTNADRKTT